MRTRNRCTIAIYNVFVFDSGNIEDIDRALLVDFEGEDGAVPKSLLRRLGKFAQKGGRLLSHSAVRAVSDPLFSLALDGKDDLVVDFEQSLTTAQVNADQMNTTQKVSNTAEVKIIENVVDDLSSDFTPNVSISSQAETSVCHNKTPIKLRLLLEATVAVGIIKS